MADVKITALTAIGANPVNPATFPIPMVDLLDNVITASGTTKKVTVNQILGSGGTATLASATITGALTVDTTTLVVNPSGYADRVGIGTATPAYLLDIADATIATRFVATNTNNSAFGAGVYLKTLNGASMVSNATLATSNDGTFNLLTGTSADSTKLSISTAGNVSVSLGNVVMGTANKGIDFSINSDASATSELLNDYEEGTWVPGVSFGGGVTGIVYSENSGKYTKIGRQVTVSAFIDFTNKGSSTGNVLITGLPFTIGAANSNYTAASLVIVRITFADYPMAFGTPSATSLEVQEVTNAGVRTNLTDADFANNSQIILGFTYTV